MSVFDELGEEKWDSCFLWTTNILLAIITLLLLWNAFSRPDGEDVVIRSIQWKKGSLILSESKKSPDQFCKALLSHIFFPSEDEPYWICFRGEISVFFPANEKKIYVFGNNKGTKYYRMFRIAPEVKESFLKTFYIRAASGKIIHF